MLADFFENITLLLEGLVHTVGLPGIALVALLENLFPPTPSEFLYPLAGKLAYDSSVSPLLVIAAGVLGSLVGSLLYYTLGRRLGPQRVRDLLLRYGTLHVWRLRLRFVSPQDYDRALELFGLYGGRIVLVARIMPVVHSVVSIPAGVVGMPLLPFVVYTLVGSLLWIAPLTLLGYWLGSQWPAVLDLMRTYENVWYAAAAVLGCWWLLRRIRRMRAAEARPAGTD